MKNILHIAFIGLFLMSLASCNYDKSTKRSIQYMSDTDMYTAVPYDAYTSNPYFENGISAQLPVEGTIARGTTVYEYPFTEEGYQSAKVSLKSPIAVNEKNLAEGKDNYDIYCAICHGVTGDGQGTLVTNEKFLGVPNYKDRDISQGSIYHVIMYGRNMMGSHASQLRENERWQVVQYVEKLRADLIK